MNLEIITREEFDRFKKEILDALQPMSQNQNKKYLRSAEMRKMLNVSAATLQNMRVKGTLPYIKIGTTILYDLDKVVEIFDDNSHNLKET
jgi:hypothetical protein